MTIESVIQKLIECNNVPEGKFGYPLQKPYEDFVKANAFTVTVLNDYQTILNYNLQRKKYKNDKDTLQGIDESITYYEKSLEENLRNFEEWHKKRVAENWLD